MTSSIKLPLILFFASSLLFHATLGIYVNLYVRNCRSMFVPFPLPHLVTGKRCLLENFEAKNGKVDYQCRTSEVIVEKMAEHIETDACVNACGVDRNTVGISSDSLLEPQLTAKLCSSDCYQKCPNIIDLYFNLAAGEGVFLPDLCEKQRTNPRRAMLELLSSGAAASAAGPAASESQTSDSVGALARGVANIGQRWSSDHF